MLYDILGILSQVYLLLTVYLRTVVVTF